MKYNKAMLISKLNDKVTEIDTEIDSLTEAATEATTAYEAAVAIYNVKVAEWRESVRAELHTQVDNEVDKVSTGSIYVHMNKYNEVNTPVQPAVINQLAMLKNRKLNILDDIKRLELVEGPSVTINSKSSDFGRILDMVV